MKHWMFSCRDISQKASLSMDVALPLHHRLAIRLHMMMCRYCARLHRQWIILRKISQADDMDQPIEPASEKLSAEAKTRIKEKLRSLR